MTTVKPNKLALLVCSLLATQAHAAKQEVMVVTASGFQQKIEDSAASISVITREQLEKRAYRDVTDALKDVPGVVVTGGGSSSDISIRGMGSKYTLMLVDGKRWIVVVLAPIAMKLVSSRAGCRHCRRSSALRSSVVPCHSVMVQMPWVV